MLYNREKQRIKSGSSCAVGLWVKILCSNDLQIRNLCRLKIIREKIYEASLFGVVRQQRKNDVNICVPLTDLVKSPRDKLSAGTALQKMKTDRYFLQNTNLNSSTDYERPSLIVIISQKFC